MLLGDDFVFKLFRNNDCNGVRVVLAQKSLSEANSLFIELMNRLGIKKVNLTSIGNSIATGFSFNDSLIPLLKRNSDLVDRADFDLKLRAYARAEDNCDSNIFEWLEGNFTQSQINELVRFDYQNKYGMFRGLYELLDDKNQENVKYAKKKIHIIDKIVEKYYPDKVEDDIGLNDLVKQNESGLANIFIYNGYTGGFLDKVTRNGLPNVLRGFVRDKDALKASLRKIFTSNPHAQVYLCGMPNITGLNITYIKNRDLIEICREFPNCVYVAPVTQNFVYKTKEGKFSIDIHYNDEEYLNFNANIMNAIVNNYVPTKILIEFDIYMRNLSDQFRKMDTGLGEDKIQQIFRTKADEYFDEIHLKNKLSVRQLEKIRAYYKEEYPHRFYYSPREYVVNRINQEINNKKKA